MSHFLIIYFEVLPKRTNFFNNRFQSFLNLLRVGHVKHVELGIDWYWGNLPDFVSLNCNIYPPILVYWSIVEIPTRVSGFSFIKCQATWPTTEGTMTHLVRTPMMIPRTDSSSKTEQWRLERQFQH